MKAERRFDAVLFDFGGVLGSSPAAAMTSRMDAFGLTFEQFLPLALGPLEEDGDHPWHRAERGETDLTGAIEGIIALAKEAGHESFPTPPTTDEMLTTMSAVPEMVAVAREARSAGYRTAIVSNMISDWSAWRAIVDADDLVDVVIDSSEVGLRKPDPAIFELALDRLGVAASRAVFLDDFPWNLPAAAALGIETVQVSDPVVAAAELRDLLFGA